MHCIHQWTILFRSTNTKMCRICKATKPWNLDPGQKPLITSSRDKDYGANRSTSIEPT